MYVCNVMFEAECPSMVNTTFTVRIGKNIGQHGVPGMCLGIWEPFS